MPCTSILCPSGTFPSSPLPADPPESLPYLLMAPSWFVGLGCTNEQERATFGLLSLAYLTQHGSRQSIYFPTNDITPFFFMTEEHCMVYCFFHYHWFIN
jgi:hypothetical protein